MGAVSPAFAVGDKVRRKAEFRDHHTWNWPLKDQVLVIAGVTNGFEYGQDLHFNEVIGSWDSEKFEYALGQFTMKDAADLMRKATEVPSDPLKSQVGGDHYKSLKIQPIEYITANNLGWCEGNIVKYITRWKQKNGLADIDKVIHYAQLLKKLDSENGKPTGRSDIMVAEKEGDLWEPLGARKIKAVHAIRFADGHEWDTVNGWRTA